MQLGKHPYFDDDGSPNAESKLKKAIKEGKFQYSKIQDENPGMTRLVINLTN